ncbi:MAG: hypothetical protein M0T84_17155 [Betaproteobacteria bacterium]|nr:hypothetical protein [Betaproteobacteria bacterium]
MKQRGILIGIWLLCQVGAAFIGFRMLWAAWTAPSEAWEIAVAYDALGNVAGNGRLGQTISSRAAHARPKRWACLLCELLDAVDPGHCDRAMSAEDQNLH